ncbi:FHA domain-containing protein [Nocardioides lijunqiniae]|uniref:FHA domain-containing protein n=1 Tax=Nocardioides lijunqiniae TaxID=2760832 RepID=UPI001877C848|nr:FHA domain-containing protein [Nocardioides lijunqiniae]
MPGSGTLLGAGTRWLLLGAPADAALLDRVWELLTATAPAADAVVASVVGHHGEGVSLAYVDLAPAHRAHVSRGGARVVESDGVHTLALGTAQVPGSLRLVGGVVAADAVDLRPGSAPRPPTTGGATSGATTGAPPAAVPGIIDAIPPEILASRASDPPPEPPPVVTADPVEDSRQGLDERIGHTVRRAADPDHDGHTTFRAAEAPASSPPPPTPDHLHQPTHETVLAARCTAGHLTPAFVPTCRACGRPVPPQDPARVPRPQLGVLRLPDGDTVPLDRGVVLGRQPTAPPETADWPHLVRVGHDSSYVSRTHLRVELDGWLVVATDVGSRGGTTLRVPGRAPERIRAHEPYVWEPGQVLDLADSCEVVYDVVAGVQA